MSFENEYSTLEENWKQNLKGLVAGAALAATPLDAAKTTTRPDAVHSQETINKIVDILPIQNMDHVKVYQMLKSHEGYRPKVYLDSVGKPTIGIGYNLKWNVAKAKEELASVGANYDLIVAGKQILTENQIKKLYNYSIIRAYKDCKDLFPNYNKYPPEIQMALLDMSFNLGYTAFSKFTKTRGAFNNGLLAYAKYNKTKNVRDWVDAQQFWLSASKEMLNSKWAKQVGNRATELSKLVSDFANNLPIIK
jgi:lysozyme